jgi:hypothetical protein
MERAEEQPAAQPKKQEFSEDYLDKKIDNLLYELLELKRCIAQDRMAAKP